MSGFFNQPSSPFPSLHTMCRERTKGSGILSSVLAYASQLTSTTRHRASTVPLIHEDHTGFSLNKTGIQHLPSQLWGCPRAGEIKGQAPPVHIFPHTCSSFLPETQACSTPPCHHNGCSQCLECPLPLDPITSHAQASPPWGAFLRLPGPLRR